VTAAGAEVLPITHESQLEELVSERLAVASILSQPMQAVKVGVVCTQSMAIVCVFACVHRLLPSSTGGLCGGCRCGWTTIMGPTAMTWALQLLSSADLWHGLLVCPPNVRSSCEGREAVKWWGYTIVVECWLGVMLQRLCWLETRCAGSGIGGGRDVVGLLVKAGGWSRSTGDRGVHSPNGSNCCLTWNGWESAVELAAPSITAFSVGLIA
jgi:hypothetical protein